MLQKNYFHRHLMGQLKKWINRREIFAIKGPRQSGKTTLLKMLKEYLIEKKKINPDNIIFITFEDRDILEKFSEGPKEFVRSYIGQKNKERFYFLLDEFHYVEEGGQKLKLLYDLFENIKFIITGSSSLELTGKTAKYLVGRMFSFYLPQLSFAEYIHIKSQQMKNVYTERSKLLKDFIIFGKDFRLEKDIFRSDFKKHFEEYSLFGGYPEVIKTEDLETKKVILKNIYETYVTKDIIELLRVNKVSKLRNLVKLLATRMSSLINFNNLCNETSIYFKELKNFLSILEETYIIYLLKPFYTNKATELRKNPKLYFMDTGLRNFAIDNFKGIPLRTDKGNLIENAAFIQLHINFPEIPLKYWRTLAKAEVDFVLEREKDLVPIEIKYANLSEPKISRSYRSFLLKYKPQNALVLTQGYCGQLKVNSCRVKFVPIWYL
ncbi:MAG: ATP-binding protein [Candidatus Aminicenantes bacterium]